MGKHTPAPWIVSGDRVVTKDCNTTKVIFRHNTEGSVGHQPDFPGWEQAQANAARIVECVNALEGVENPSGVKAALEAIAREADRELRAIGESRRRGDQSKADSFRYIRDQALSILGRK
jgi:hypothetical protein